MSFTKKDQTKVVTLYNKVQ